MKNRCLSIFLLLFLMLNLLPPTVKAAEGDVCKINEIGYATLSSALAASTDGSTITLLKDFSHSGGIVITNKAITFDVQSFTLNITNSSGPGLDVGGTGSVNLVGTGAFNVTGTSYGVYAHGGEVTVTNAKGTNTSSYGVFASYAKVTVLGYAQGLMKGVHAEGGTVSVSGNAIASGVVGDEIYGAYAYGGTVTIGGDALGYTFGAAVENSGRITVGGNARATGTAEGKYYFGACTFTGTIVVNGNVEGRSYGAYVNFGAITVNGNITSASCGAYSYNNGVVRVNGTITAPTYITVGGVNKSSSQGVVDGDYYKYSDGANVAYVYVNIPPTITGLFASQSILPSVGGSSNITVSGLKLPSGSVTVTAFDGGTATDITGIATGSPTSQTISLTFPAAAGEALENKIYTIKASLNSGTSWDADITTVSVRPSPIPVNTITITGASGSTTVLNGNSLQMSAIVEPDDADFKQVIWSIAEGNENATIAESGLLTGINEGTATVKATSTDGSGVYGAAVITIAPKPVMSGFVTITGDVKYAEVLSTNISGITYTPATSSDIPSYQWKRNGVDIPGATNSSYSLVQADIGSIINVMLTADGTNAMGSVTSEPTVTVEKADGPVAPPAPTLWNKSHTNIRLYAISGAEYSINGGPWQSDSNFTGLNPETIYSFTARIKETATHNASNQSEATAVTTNAAPLYTVTYQANGGSGTAPVESSKTEGTIFTAATADSLIPPVEKHFFKWNTKADGTGTSYMAGANVIMPAANLIIYAVWETTTYIVAYDLNGGTGAAPTESNKAKDATFTAVSSNSFTPPAEKYFLEWNTASDGGGTGYAAGATVTMPSGGITLYAIWETTTYTVTYNSNGGTGSPPIESNKAKDETFTAAASDSFTPLEEKYFLNWNTAPDGSGANYAAGATITMPSGNMILYAIWETTTYTVAYDANGGTGAAPSEGNKAKNAIFTAAASDSFTPPEEKHFLKWNTVSDGSGTSYAAGATVTMPSGNLTLYAIWETTTYTVIYDFNGRTGTAPIESRKAKDATFAAANNSFIPSIGERFKEWNTNADGSGTGYVPGANVTMPSGNLTLYAVWELINYTVTYYANGGIGTVPVETYKTNGETFTVASADSITPPENMQFKIWNTAADGSGTNYAPGASITIATSNITLHAMWKTATYTVIYDGNGNTGGSVPLDPNIYTLGNFVYVLWNTGDLVKSGYGFVGWNTERDGTGTLFTEGAMAAFIMEGANVTLYAQWSPVISDDFSDPNFKQAVWEWLGNPIGSAPMSFTKFDLVNRFRYWSAPSLSAYGRDITSLAGVEHFNDTPLKHLNCSDNQLVSLPDLPDNLESLYCNSNNLTSLPELPDTLRRLNCSSNELTTLPNIPATLVSLECNMNNLTSIPNLPESLAELHSAGNRLTSIPELPTGLNSIGVFWNYINFAESPNKENIEECTATSKSIYPQFRYDGRSENISMVVGNSHSLVNELYRRNTYDGSTWENAVLTIVPSQFSFISSDTNIVTVDQEGKLTAIGDGSCKITALLYGIDAEFTKVEFNVTAVTLYHITYDANGATGTAPLESDKAAGDIFAAASNSFTPPEGKRFKEWNTAADGNGNSYVSAANVIMPASNLHLYAIWENIPTYTVTYNGNGNTGGTVPIDNNSYLENNLLVVSENTGGLIKPGFCFVGWNTVNDGTGIRYTNEDILTIGTANVILYAQWSLIISNDFTDANFKQAIWEWIGNPLGSEPGTITKQDLIDGLWFYGPYLDISNSNISSLNGFEHFQGTEFRGLACSGNDLISLPDLPESLELLICDNNKLTGLPALPDSLWALKFDNNRINSLPVLPENLEVLLCSNNYLTNLPVLPDSLAYIDFRYNYLKSISGRGIEELGDIESDDFLIYPQYKYKIQTEEIQLVREDTYSMEEELSKMSYSLSGWSEIDIDADMASFDFWSSNTMVATVNSQGVITAKGAGSCEVLALLGGADSEYTKVQLIVTVSPKEGDNLSTDLTYNAIVTDSSLTTLNIPLYIDNTSRSANVSLEQSTASALFNNKETSSITMPSIPGVDTYTLNIPTSVITNGTAGSTLTFSTAAGSITLPGHMLKGIPEAKGTNARITIGHGDISSLPDTVKKMLGDRPIVQLALTVDGKKIAWNNPDASVAVSIPYLPTLEELKDPEHIVILYIDGNGELISIPNGRYDPETKTVNFTTTHFSYYAVAYVYKTFDDLDSVAWAKKSIEVMSSKGIINGTGNNMYSPKAQITRADYVVILVKTLGISAKIDSNFDDVNKADYYYEAIGIAKKLGITSGSGDNKFNPNTLISRQDMIVLTARALEKINKIKLINDFTILDSFIDKADIAEYAIESIAALVREGLLIGSENMITPGNNTTRAEAAVFLYRIYKSILKS